MRLNHNFACVFLLQLHQPKFPRRTLLTFDSAWSLLRLFKCDSNRLLSSIMTKRNDTNTWPLKYIPKQWRHPLEVSHKLNLKHEWQKFIFMRSYLSGKRYCYMLTDRRYIQSSNHSLVFHVSMPILWKEAPHEGEWESIHLIIRNEVWFSGPKNNRMMTLWNKSFKNHWKCLKPWESRGNIISSAIPPAVTQATRKRYSLSNYSPWSLHKRELGFDVVTAEEGSLN